MYDRANSNYNSQIRYHYAILAVVVLAIIILLFCYRNNTKTTRKLSLPLKKAPRGRRHESFTVTTTNARENPLSQPVCSPILDSDDDSTIQCQSTIAVSPSKFSKIRIRNCKKNTIVTGNLDDSDFRLDRRGRLVYTGADCGREVLYSYNLVFKSSSDNVFTFGIYVSPSGACAELNSCEGYCLPGSITESGSSNGEPVSISVAPFSVSGLTKKSRLIPFVRPLRSTSNTADACTPDKIHIDFLFFSYTIFLL
jgi:hypothetical protein